MSHFTTLVVLPKAIQNRSIDAAVTDLLAPYDENKEVPVHKVTCGCVGHKARMEASAAADKKHGNVDQIRAAFRASHAIPAYPAETATAEEIEAYKKADATLNAEWAKALRPWERAKAAALAKHPDRRRADKACEDCKGTGRRETTYNPKSQWDWWVIGGRWDKALGGANVIPVEALLLRKKLGYDKAFAVPTFAVVTPDGKWHQKGRMGWFGITSGDKPEKAWAAEFWKLLAKHRGGTAVLCDLHI